MTTEWMDDAVAVVTGAGSGIGRALALRFARHGMSVMLADIDAEGLAETESLIAELGTPVASRIVDVSDAAQVEALAEATVSEFGRVNIVCNNAGVSGGGLSWEVPLEDWQWTIGVNLWGVIHGVRSFVPRILESGTGHIVNTASMAGFVAAPGMGPYNATKHAVVGTSETLYHELSMLNPEVSVSVLCPGWVNTNILDSERHRPSSFAPASGGSAGVIEVADSELGGAAADQGEIDQTQNVMREIVSELIRNGADPADVAELVFQAIAERRFWVFTHDDWLASAGRRYELAFGGENPQLSLPGVMSSE